MARPKKRPEYDKDHLQNNLMTMIAEAYQNPPNGTADSQGHMHLNLLAEEFGMTPIKIRKVLITMGVYETDTSRVIMDLYKGGKSAVEIQQITGLSRASVNGYLPYEKAIYKMTERTLLADRLVKYRHRKEAVDVLKYSMKNDTEEMQRLRFEQVVEAFVGYRFLTRDGGRFDYIVKDNQLFLAEREHYTYDEIFAQVKGTGVISDERIEVIIQRFGI